MLQKLFFYLQMSKGGACTTTDLTKSFGWNDAQAFEQQDVARRPIAAHTRVRASPFPAGSLPPPPRARWGLGAGSRGGLTRPRWPHFAGRDADEAVRRDGDQI